MSLFLLASLLLGNPVARAAYEQALAAWNRRTEQGLSEGLRLFEKAAELDPSFAEAHAGVADASCLLALYGYRAPSEVMPRAREAALEALRLDGSLAKAHASLGLVRYIYEWRFEQAEQSFEKAIALDPGYVAAHHWYAMMRMATGRTSEALAEIEKAISQEPENLLYAVKRGTILLAAGRLEEAGSHLTAVVERHPEFPLAHRELGLVELEGGRPAKARLHLERAAELSSGAERTEAAYGLVLGLLGEEEKARAMLHALREDEATGFVSPIAEALLHVGLGEKREALDALERALELRDPALVYVATQPGLAPLRAEPRFRALVEKMGL